MPGVPPVPIPNTAVKPRAANGSRTLGPARVGCCQDYGPSFRKKTRASSFSRLDLRDPMGELAKIGYSHLKRSLRSDDWGWIASFSQSIYCLWLPGAKNEQIETQPPQTLYLSCVCIADLPLVPLNIGRPSNRFP